jgi:hypothetical protein
LEVVRRLEQKRYAGKRLAHGIHGKDPASARRVYDFDASRYEPLEDDEVSKLPMEYRSRMEELEFIDLHAYASPAKPVPSRSIEEGVGVASIAIAASKLLDLARSRVLSVVGEHHGKTSSAALRGRQLADLGNSPPGTSPDPSCRGEARLEGQWSALRGRHRNANTPATA